MLFLNTAFGDGIKRDKFKAFILADKPKNLQIITPMV
jgi:hypothetical protein